MGTSLLGCDPGAPIDDSNRWTGVRYGHFSAARPADDIAYRYKVPDRDLPGADVESHGVARPSAE
jgi:hypothetical protein